MQNYETFLRKYITLNAVEMAAFRLMNKTLLFKKGETIRYADDVHTAMYFLESGLARAYFLDDSGKDLTWHFYFNTPQSHETNLFVVDYHSFTTQTPSNLQFEALDDCVIHAVSKRDIDTMHLATKKWVVFILMMADRAYGFVHQKYFAQLTLSAQERYDQLIEQMPHLCDMVPQYHIATYIGVTPQHLSRLKKRHSEQM